MLSMESFFRFKPWSCLKGSFRLLTLALFSSVQEVAFDLCDRWDFVSMLLEDEIGETYEEQGGPKIRKWLGYVSLLIESQQWDLANGLYRKISATASQSCSPGNETSERSPWEEVQYTWAVTSAQKMKDFGLAASIVDDMIAVHLQNRLIDTKRVCQQFESYNALVFFQGPKILILQVFNFCLGIVATLQQKKDDPTVQILEWLLRSLKLTEESSQVFSKLQTKFYLGFILSCHHNF
jgi:hypothetical protein